MSEHDLPEEPDRHPGAPHPRHVDALVGQQHALTEFDQAEASGRLHHAWLITGPRGIGKATLAWTLARRLLKGDSTASDTNETLRQIANLSSPDLILCRRPWDEKRKRLKTAITVDEIREIKSYFQMSSARDNWRVAIIDCADEMTGSSANALLKILEEPPARSVFFLVSHRPSMLLPTIRSRCRELRGRPLGRDALAQVLGSCDVTIDPDEANALEILSAGSAGAALDLASGDGIQIYGQLIQLLLNGPPLDRQVVRRICDACATPANSERFRITIDLLELLLGRIARAAAGMNLATVSDTEAQLFARFAGAPGTACTWAELGPKIRARSDQARLVNLDPAQVMHDTFAQIGAAVADMSQPVA
ncbi:DNA polymerase III subunit delta' [Amaricoccus tamworthensis]|uniref:DNA polymerase III subunit delta' n=1 Tax=Amaricoccus tamworthensis TaxID=57002 RepID=UPI003C7EB4A2